MLAVNDKLLSVDERIDVVLAYFESQKEADTMRKDRSDQTVGSHEKKHGLPPGTVRNPDGRDTRSDKKIGTIRKEGEKGKK